MAHWDRHPSANLVFARCQILDLQRIVRTTGEKKLICGSERRFIVRL
jgi:hypothetical protein